MAYCTQDDVEVAAGGEERLRQLADNDRNGVADSDTVSRAIAAAGAWMDGIIEKRIAVPIATVPQRIKDIAADEAVYIMKRWRDMATEDDREDHAERKVDLEHIAKGMATTGLDPAPPKSSLVVDKYSARSSDRAVSREKLKGYA